MNERADWAGTECISPPVSPLSRKEAKDSLGITNAGRMALPWTDKTQGPRRVRECACVRAFERLESTQWHQQHERASFVPTDRQGDGHLETVPFFKLIPDRSSSFVRHQIGPKRKAKSPINCPML